MLTTRARADQLKNQLLDKKVPTENFKNNTLEILELCEKILADWPKAYSDAQKTDLSVILARLRQVVALKLNKLQEYKIRITDLSEKNEGLVSEISSLTEELNEIKERENQLEGRIKEYDLSFFGEGENTYEEIENNREEVRSTLESINSTLGNLKSLTEDTKEKKMPDPNLSLMGSVPNFDGKKMTAQHFLSLFAHYGDLGNWDDDTKLKIAKIKTAEFAEKFKETDPDFEKIATWDDFKKKFPEKCQRFESIVTAHSNLFRLMLEPEEDIESFANRVAVATKKIVPMSGDATKDAVLTGLKQNYSLAFFLNGLPSHIKTRVESQNPASFEDAIKAALKCEATLAPSALGINLVNEEIQKQVEKAIKENANKASNDEQKLDKLTEAVEKLTICLANSAANGGNIQPQHQGFGQNQGYGYGNGRGSYRGRGQRGGGRGNGRGSGQGQLCFRCYKTGHIARNCRVSEENFNPIPTRKERAPADPNATAEGQNAGN